MRFTEFSPCSETHFKVLSSLRGVNCNFEVTPLWFTTLDHPGLPKAANRSAVQYSLDLNGLCGLAPTDDTLGRRTREKTKQGSWTKNSTSPNNEAAQPQKGGRKKHKVKKACRKSSSPSLNSSGKDAGTPANAAVTRQTTNKTTPSIKRKTRRRKRTLLSSSNSTSPNSVVCPSDIHCSLPTSPAVPMTSSPAEGQQATENRGSGSLEQHFHHLHIVSLDLLNACIELMEHTHL